MQEDMQADMQVMQEENQWFTKRNIIYIIILIDALILLSILAPKFGEIASLSSTSCKILSEKYIEKKICKTQECRGKGRKTKCKAVSYDCFSWVLFVEANNVRYTVRSKNPVKIHEEAQNELSKFTIDTVIPCYSKGNGEAITFEYPSFKSEAIFGLAFLVLSAIAIFAISFYMDKGQNYKYKAGLSKKDLKKSVNKLKIKMN